MTTFLCRKYTIGVSCLLRVGRLLIAAFFLANVAHAAEVLPPGKAFGLSLQKNDLDLRVFTEWENGEETMLANPDQIVWTSNSAPGYKFLNYGQSDRLGLRHLRIGFTKNMAVGTVIVSGGGRLSVLKPGAVYPGRLDHDDDWLPAQRLVEEAVSTAEEEPTGLAAWVLPAPHNDASPAVYARTPAHRCVL